MMLALHILGSVSRREDKSSRAALCMTTQNDQYSHLVLADYFCQAYGLARSVR